MLLASTLSNKRFAAALLTFSMLLVSSAHAEPLGDFTACKSNLKMVGSALDSYAKEHNSKYPSSLATLGAKYLKPIPTCPAAGRDTYSAGFKLDPKDGYRVSCSGHHHGALGYAANQPSYSGLTGLIELQPSAKNVKNAQVTFVGTSKIRYAIQIPNGWLYKNGSADGLVLTNPLSPGAEIACGDVLGSQDVDQWYKESLAAVESEGMKPLTSRLRNVAGLKGFQIKLKAKGRTLLGYYAADGEKNIRISLGAPDAQFATLEKDFEALLRTLQQSRR